MIIGSGLLAQTFSQYAGSDKVLVFASGVSNSSANVESAFEREISLLKSHLDTKMKLVYFSTVSVYDPDLSSSPYILHKRKIEQIITQECASYIIFRLPILLGRTNNPNTLCNYIHNAIMHENEIAVFDKACRYLFDTEDLKTLLPGIIEDPALNCLTLDINFDNAIKIADLISIFEIATRRKAKTKILHKGGCYTTNNQWFINYLKQRNVNIPQTYLKDSIEKYYGSGDFNI